MGMDRELLEQTIEHLRNKMKDKSLMLDNLIDQNFVLVQEQARLKDELADQDALIYTLQQRLKHYGDDAR